MKLAALFSGGKDSCYAIYKARAEKHEITVLITFSSKRDDSYMFHFPNVKLTGTQAKLIGIPLIYAETGGEEGKELADLKAVLQKARDDYKIEGVVCGALASEYQKSRVENICMELGLSSLAPLWKVDVEKYMNELLENKFRFVITGVAADGLDESWLGKEINKASLSQLKKIAEKYRIHLGGEGGEYETFVLNCPLFKNSLEIQKARKIWNGTSGRLEIQKINKSS